MRTILNWLFIAAGLASVASAHAQETPGKRLAGIVAVALAEYRLGVDDAGKVISQVELDEARSFMIDAKDAAGRVAGSHAPAVRALVDSLAAAIEATKLPADVGRVHDRLVIALGDDAALDYRTGHFDLGAGKKIYERSCASCHGMSGAGDGQLGKGMDPPPAPLSGTQARDLAPGLMYRVVSVGIKGTAMPAWADSLSSDQRWDVVHYVHTMRVGANAATITTTPGVDPAKSSSEVNRLLDEAMDAGRNNRLAEAGERAFDAYMRFEPLETILRGKNPGLVTTLEGDFLAFRTALRGGKIPAADSALIKIRGGLGQAVAVASSSSGPWTMFGQSLLIILREGFEAILIIGAIVAMLARTGNQTRVKDVWVGAALGVVASVGVAILLRTTLRELPASRETIEGATLLVAVAVLFSVSYWVMSKIEARHWQEYVRGKVNAALARGGRAAILGVGFLVVFREGAETALFYQALVQQPSASMVHLIGGIIVGATLLAGVYVLLNRFGVKIPLRHFFAVTGLLLYAMSVVFMGKGLRELQEGGAIGTTPLGGWPTIDAIGLYPSIETVAGQGLLVLLFALACWHTFVRPLRRP
jgi:high-affinity iron transporter